MGQQQTYITEINKTILKTPIKCNANIQREQQPIIPSNFSSFSYTNNVNITAKFTVGCGWAKLQHIVEDFFVKYSQQYCKKADYVFDIRICSSYESGERKYITLRDCFVTYADFTFLGEFVVKCDYYDEIFEDIAPGATTDCIVCDELTEELTAKINESIKKQISETIKKHEIIPECVTDVLDDTLVKVKEVEQHTEKINDDLLI